MSLAPAGRPVEIRFQRVQVSVLGRYMLADRREFPCQILEMSPGDAVVIAPVAGIVGERVIAYLDHLGRIEGQILEQIEGGFVMDIAASPRKRDKMAAQLTWLANKDVLNLPEDRRHERVVPDIRHSTVVLDDAGNTTARSSTYRSPARPSNSMCAPPWAPRSRSAACGPGWCGTSRTGWRWNSPRPRKC